VQLTAFDNAISERWVKSARTECLDHLLVLNEAHLRRAISGYAAYFNYWRPHWSLGQRAPCESTCISFDLARPPARSRPSLSWVDCITSIGVLPDGLYLRPSAIIVLARAAEASFLASGKRPRNGNDGHRRRFTSAATLNRPINFGAQLDHANGQSRCRSRVRRPTRFWRAVRTSPGLGFVLCRDNHF
jgi:hypothetical protein